MSTKYEITSLVLENRMLSADTCALDFYAPEIAENSLPGQFVMIEAAGKFLRRPISIAGSSGKRITLTIRIIGDGTKILCSLRRNMRVKMLGPLGNPFPDCDGKKILAGGGIGIAPILFLAQKTLDDDTILIYGEQTAENLISSEFLPENTEIATDDGSSGFCGNVCEFLSTFPPAQIFACGPMPMLQKLSGIGKEWNVQTWISLEARMACGFGVCHGCVVDTKDGYKRVCTEGPVFNANEIFL